MSISRRTMLIQSAAGAVGFAAGCKHFDAGTPKPGGGNGTYKVGLVYFAPEDGADLCQKGIFDGFKAQGLEKDRNLQVLMSHAQGEIANIPMLIQNYVSQNVDLIMTMTTPCLTAACSMAKNSRVVFTYVYDPIAAGAGTTFESHLPNITGVGSFPPVEATVDTLQKLVPGVKAVGTVYNTSEANSVKVIKTAREVFQKHGIRLEEATATNTSEVFTAAQAACSRKVQAIWVTGDNTALQSFDGIVKATQNAKLPLVINDPEFTARGAVACVGLGWYAPGKAGGELAARVLQGANPANIPFQEVAIQKIVLNQDAAHALGIVFPPEMQKAAQATA